MPKIYNCLLGHQWEDPHLTSTADGCPPCPVCGAAAQTVSMSLAPHAEPPAAAAAPGRPDVPGYQIEGVLGRGGMGVVYRARQLALNRPVALKMVLAGAHAAPEDLVRFLGEAEAAARLQHPNIVPVYEVGRLDGRPYFTAELVEGGTLAQQLGGKPQPARRAAELVETLARAVQYAHGRGVIHRDLKPANVLLTPDGTPKVTDFGLAKRLEGGHGLTQSGAVLGTPNYMSPEQAAGISHQIGPAVDVYALGAILYELLTGRPPFQAETPWDTVLQVLTVDPVPVRRLQPKAPRDLETIALKCLHKDPRKRYASAEALADDLRRFLDGRPILARPTGALERAVRWCRRNPVVAGLLGMLAAVTVAGFTAVTWQWLEADAQRERAESATGVATEKARQEASARKDAELARGEALRKAEAEAKAKRNEARVRRHLEANLYVAQIKKAVQIWPTNVAEAERTLDECPPRLRHWEWYFAKRCCNPEAVALPGHTGGIARLAYSPDGTRLASASADGTVKIWDVATARELRTLPRLAGTVAAVAFSPDAKRLAAAGNTAGKRATGNAITVFEADTGRQVLTLKGHADAVTALAYSPDGKRLASSSGSFERLKASGEVKVWDAASGKELFTAAGPKGFHLRVAFSPDGSRLAADGFLGPPTVWDATTGRVQLALTGLAPSNGVAFSPDGKYLACGSAHQVRLLDARTGKVVRTFASHIPGVMDLAFSPNGNVLATAGADKLVRLWDVNTGREVFTFRGHRGPVSAVAFHPRGGGLASGSLDRTVQLWGTGGLRAMATFTTAEGLIMALASSPDGRFYASGAGSVITVRDTRTNAVAATLRGHTLPVTTLAFSADGNRLISSAMEHQEFRGAEVKVWDVPGARELFALGKPTHLTLGVDYSPDGKRLATADNNRTLRLWDARTGKEVLTLRDQPTPIMGLSFSPDGSRLAVAADEELRVLDTASGKRLLAVSAHKPMVVAVRYSPDGRHLATGGMDGVLKIWDAADGKVVFTLRGHAGVIRSLSFSPDGRRLASAAWDRTTRVWDLTTGEEVLTLTEAVVEVAAAAFSADGRRLLTACGPTVYVRDALGDAALFTLHGHAEWLYALALSPDGTRLLTGGADRTVRVWDAVSAEQVAVLHGPTLPIHGLAVSPDGRSFAVTGGQTQQTQQPGELTIWDGQTGRLKLSQPVPGGTAYGVAYSPDGKHLALTCADGTVRIWEASAGREVRALKGHHGPVTSVAYSPDGARLATGGSDFAVRLWDAATGRPLRVLRGHEHVVQAVAFSPDGKRLASAGWDHTLRIWDPDTGATLRTYRGQTGEIRSLAFSPDGSRLAVGGVRAIKVIDAATGREIHTLTGHTEGVTGLAFRPDGRRLASVSLDGTVRLWEPDGVPGRVESLPPASLERLRREVKGHETAGRWLTAVVCLNRLIEEEPSDGELRARRGNAYVTLKEWDKGIADLSQALELETDTWQVRIDRGVAYEQTGRYEQALAEFSAAIARDAKGALGWYDRGIVHGRLHSWDRAVADHTRAIELGLAGWQILDKRGTAYAELGRWAEASADYTRATEQESSHPVVWFRAALLCAHRRDSAGYRRLCEGMMRRFRREPGDIPPRLIAWTCSLAPGALADPSAAVRAGGRAVARAPHLRTSHTALGAALYRAGRWKDAIRSRAEASKLAGGEGTAEEWVFLALSHAQLGQKDEARRWLKRVADAARAPRSDSPPAWADRLVIELLRREAEALLR
jgi:WD40 repeat protein/tetratricopeptide (TPR) repeat protein